MTEKQEKNCKVKSSWFNQTDENNILYSRFLKKKSENEILCLPCDAVIKIKNKGFSGITQHLKYDKHKNDKK